MPPASNCIGLLDISTAPTKEKSRKTAYSQVLDQNKIGRLEVKIQRVRQIIGYGEWCLELRREGGREKRTNKDGICKECFQVWVKCGGETAGGEVLVSS